MSPIPLLPAKDDKIGWKAIWYAQGQNWRSEPGIDTERQKYLADRRNIKIDIEQGIYPFKDIKLSRADVEWLLATHSDGTTGPVDWSDKSQRGRKGLDLRGADLRGVNLSLLPLAMLIGGLPVSKQMPSTDQIEAAAVHLEGADLSFTHLEDAWLPFAHLEGADLSYAHLESALLLSSHLERINLSYARLEGADLAFARLEGADLTSAHLEGATLSRAHLERANLSEAFFDGTTKLNSIFLTNNRSNAASLVDIHWGDANIAVVDWSTLYTLGDEKDAQIWKRLNSNTPPNEEDSLYDYRKAARAYRQLSVLLRNQGLNEEAARFAYRAQLMQREVFNHQNKLGQYLFSLFLDLLAGYGYKPWRSFATYIVVICIFAAIYFLLGPHLAWNEAIVISMTAFHGRGFFPDQFKPGDPQALVAAIEAFVGLLIEVTFIATLTQRLFGK